MNCHMPLQTRVFMPSFTPGSILSEPREFYNLLTFLILRAVAGVESLLQCEGVFQPGFLSSPSSQPSTTSHEKTNRLDLT